MNPLVEPLALAARAAHEAPDVVDASLRLGLRLGNDLPVPAAGRTWLLWSSAGR